jgi:anti-sigma factor RsiW
MNFRLFESIGDSWMPSQVEASCDAVRPLLGSYVDGELRGHELADVSRHLETCLACGREAEGLSGLGDLLRSAAHDAPPPPEMGGLAGGVVSRVGAESAQSWHGLFERAVEDWHWVIVGAGSVAATFVSTMFLSLVLTFGPAPQRPDSLAALMSNLGSPAGTLFLIATPVSGNGDWVVMQVDDGRPQASRAMTALVRPASAERLSERELVDRLSDAVTRKGRLIDLNEMHPMDRMYTEALLDEINSLHTREPAQAGGTVSVGGVRLVASTGVSAKGL